MKSCLECGDVFKYDRNGVKSKEHFERFHAPPELNKDDIITLNATHIICLIVKGNESWEKYYKRTKKKHDSWLVDGKLLQEFEQENNIEFQYCRSSEEITYYQLQISIWERIKKWLNIF